MSTSSPALGAEATAGSAEYTPAQMLATLGVSPEEFGMYQERMRQSFNSPQATHPGWHNKSLPYPLNLPPSYPSYPSTIASSALTRHPRPGSSRHGAPVMPETSMTPTVTLEGYTRAPSASSSKGKVKRSLDAFMDSRQGTRVQESDSSGSDSETSLIKMLGLPQVTDSQDSALPSSSPPSSSPIHTPKESSPIRTMHGYPSSPTPRPKRQCSARADTSDAPYTLPLGPYSRDKPSWSLAALIGQAINASHTGALALNDLYTYISTVYPYYNRRDQPWMSSVRHSLSVNDAFERVPDQDGNASRKGRGRGMTKLKGGLWRIKPGHQACFEGGNFIRKGAKGPGPGKNQGGRKRLREPAEEPSSSKKIKFESNLSQTDSLSQSNAASGSSSSQNLLHTASGSSGLPSPPAAPGDSPSPPCSTATPPDPPSLMPSQPIAADLSFHGHRPPPSSPMFSKNPTTAPGIVSHRSTDLPPALTHQMKPPAANTDSSVPTSLLGPGFELAMKGNQQSLPEFVSPRIQDQEANRELFTRVFSSTSSAYPPSSRGPSDSSKPARLFPPPFHSSPHPGSSSSPIRPITPPPSMNNSLVTLSPVRTPMSHRGLHMSPSRSLAHYKSSLEPEWKSKIRPMTPPPSNEQGEGEDGGITTPTRPSSSLQFSPFRTPARPSRPGNGKGYDPYDPDTLLADELASIRKAREVQESPGGFFGKEGKKLLYESPSLPGQSDWRFRDEL